MIHDPCFVDKKKITKPHQTLMRLANNMSVKIPVHIKNENSIFFFFKFDIIWLVIEVLLLLIGGVL